MPRDLRVHAALVAVALIYGANYSIAKLVMPEFIRPFGLIVLRVATAGLFFMLLQPFLKKEKIQRADWPRLVACSVFGVAMNQMLFFKGLSITSPVHASVLMLVTPILVLIAASIVLRERVTYLRWLGIALGVTGASLLVLSARHTDGIASVAGDVMVFINAASYALYLVLVKPLLRRYNALTVTKYTFLFALPMVLPFGYQEVLAVDWLHLPLHIWLSLGFILLGVTVMAYLLNAWTMQYVSPAMVGSYIYLQPVFAVAIALAAGQDSLSWQKGVYILIIFIGVYLSRQRPRVTA